jgi:hypothetical protein
MRANVPGFSILKKELAVARMKSCGEFVTVSLCQMPRALSRRRRHSDIAFVRLYRAIKGAATCRVKEVLVE